MAKYILKRVAEAFVILLVIMCIVFVLVRMMPKDGYFGEDANNLTPEQKEMILDEMGLNDPIIIQLGRFFVDLAHGDLGDSLIYRPNVPVAEILADKAPYSAAFGVCAFVLSYIIGIPLGVVMALYKGKLPDKVGTGYIVVINAVPAAVYFLFIQIYFTDFLKIPMLFRLNNPVTWILPMICMSLGGIAGQALWIRRFVVDELNKDYIKLATAKGLPRRTIMFRHVLKNAFVPLSHNLPANLLMQIGGSIYIESLYSIPGMGGLLVTAVQRQDNTLVQALVLIFSAIGVFGMLLGDLLMAALDPRIKLVRGGNR